MKTFIRTNETTKTGYELLVIDDNGNEIVTPIDKTPKNEPFTLVLPENPSNRKYFNSKKVDAAGGRIELSYKETKSLGQKKNVATKTPSAGLEEYLDEDEREIYLELVSKAMAKRDKQLAIEKAKRNYEKALAQYQELTK